MTSPRPPGPGTAGHGFAREGSGLGTEGYGLGSKGHTLDTNAERFRVDLRGRIGAGWRVEGGPNFPTQGGGWASGAATR